MDQLRRILVTGGSGFIGSSLVRYLKSRMRDVPDDATYLDHITVFDMIDNPIADVSIVDDICNILSPTYSNLQFDVIFHLVSYSGIRSSLDMPAETIRINTYGTSLICEYTKRLRCKLIVVSNSSLIYGSYPNPYIISKKMSEDIVKMYAQCYNLPAMCIRLHNVYGPGEPITGEFCTIINRFLIQRSNGEQLIVPIGDNIKREYTHVEDVCRALSLLSNHPNIKHGPIVDLTSGITYTYSEIAEIFGCPIIYVPGHLLDINHTIRTTEEFFTALNDIAYEQTHHVNKEHSSPDQLSFLIAWSPIHTITQYIRNTTTS